MGITKTTYNANQSVTARYLNITKDSATGIIIVDDTNGGYTVDVHTEIDRQLVWLKIVPGFESTLLDEALEGITAIDSVYGDWDKTRLLVQSSEVIVVQYSSTSKVTQQSVTGYALSSSDAIFVKIDQVENTVTLYQQ